MKASDDQTAATTVLTPTWDEYQLLDTGSGRKIERFGRFTLVRPEPQASWLPARSNLLWRGADGEFVARPKMRGSGTDGEWRFSRQENARWKMRRGNLEFWVTPSPSGHVGVFPDQACHWDWIADQIAMRVSSAGAAPAEMLSLFGHTGLATLAAAAAGARVTHVDASRKAIQQARESQALSGLSERPIRWIADDARAFIARELKRGRRYDALFLDPPRFGRGPDGEIWKLDESLPKLLRDCRKLLSDAPSFVIVNTYTTVLSRGSTHRDATKLRDSLGTLVADRSMRIEAGELQLIDSGGRKITQAVFARAGIRA